MLVFGVDVPLIEIILAFTLIIFIILIEALAVISLLIKQMNKTKKLSELVEKLSENILEIKKTEFKGLNKRKRKK